MKKIFYLIVVLVSVSFTTGCATMMTLNAGNYTAKVAKYETAYLSENQLTVSYIAVVYSDEFMKREYVTYAWASIPLVKMRETTAKSDKQEILLLPDQIHFSKLHLQNVSGTREIPIVSEDILKTLNDSPVTGSLAKCFYNDQNDYSRSALNFTDGVNGQAKILLSGQGRHLWGYLAILTLSPISLAVDIVTFPIQMYTWVYMFSKFHS